MKKELISNHSTRLLDILNEQLNQLVKQQTGSFYFAVAFASFDGIQLLIDVLSRLESKSKQKDNKVKVTGKILLSDYLYFTEPKAIKTLASFKCIELKLHMHRRFKPLHSKVYVFNHQTDLNTMVIGSSNLTKTGLTENEEMNILMTLDKEDYLNQRLLEEFERCWQQGFVCDALSVSEYEKQYEAYHKAAEQATIVLPSAMIEVNDMQRQALAQLQNIRAEAGKKALIIAATGTGKTYLSAFDIKQLQPKCFLFLVHNKNILFQAQATLKQVLHQSYVIFDGDHHQKINGGLLSTSQLMYQHYQKFQRDKFDYIVIDEAHKFGGENTRIYSTLLAYFQPKFLLGMTATPERTDGFDLYRFFDDQIVANIRLRQALEMKLLVPFHYYGIADAQIVKKEINGSINEVVEEINLSSIDLDNVRELNQVLNTSNRAEYIIEKMKKYQHDGPKRKAIAFCIDIHHAQTMSEAFNLAGFGAVALTGNHNAEERQRYIQSLEDNQHSLEIICVVDIFNEGIDIPSVNLILMLIPFQFDNPYKILYNDSEKEKRWADIVNILHLNLKSLWKMHWLKKKEYLIA